jgi:hypothetical protein
MLKKIPHFLAHDSSLPLSLSRARWIQSIPPHSTSLRPILILSSDLLLGLPSCGLPSGFPTEMLHAFLSPHACYMPCQAHPPWLHHSNHIWRRVRILMLYNMWHIGRFCNTRGMSSLLGNDSVNILAATNSVEVLSMRSVLCLYKKPWRLFKTHLLVREDVT